MKLDGFDSRLLALLGTRTRSSADLATHLDVATAELEDRLADLVDNGLVDHLDGDRFRRTESGRRVLVTAAAGTVDERIDTTPAVERALDELALRPDEADAVRHAFAFLRYWGRVTEAELVDAIYREAPAGRETPEDWWGGLVRDSLAALPGVERSADTDEPWRYTGTPEAVAPATDGRLMLSKTHPVYGDVKHALESLELTDPERDAARAAFGFLYRQGAVTESEIRETVYPDHTAGHDAAGVWWDAVIRETFEALPGVERTGEETWRYRRS